MSERPSTVAVIGRPPRISIMATNCSGDMYVGVPPSRWRTGSFGRIGGWARWKSRSMGVPSAASRTFEGFKSRWSNSRWWANCKASARQAPIQHTAWRYEACARNCRAGPWLGTESGVSAWTWSSAASRSRPVRRAIGISPSSLTCAPASCHRDRACTGPAGRGRRDPGPNRAARCGHAAIGRATGARGPRGASSSGRRADWPGPAGRPGRTAPRTPRPRTASRRNSPTESPAAGKAEITCWARKDGVGVEQRGAFVLPLREAAPILTVETPSPNSRRRLASLAINRNARSGGPG